MDTTFNIQGNALMSAAALVGMVLLLGGLSMLLLYFMLKGRPVAARRVTAVGALAVGGYAALLLGASAAAEGRELAPGAEKYFCEIDCHLAYSVRALEPMGAAGNSELHVVTLRARFDPTTTSARRGDRPLHMNPRRVSLIDDAGREYRPSESGMRALEARRGPQPDFHRALRPGESADVPLVFALPHGARPARLLLTDAGWETRLMIGHENSPFHPRSAFVLAASDERMSQR